MSTSELDRTAQEAIGNVERTTEETAENIERAARESLARVQEQCAASVSAVQRHARETRRSILLTMLAILSLFAACLFVCYKIYCFTEGGAKRWEYNARMGAWTVHAEGGGR
jgi:hypothetical protein